MNQALRLRLAMMDRRLLAALLAGAWLFVALEAWLLVLRAPVAEWRSLVALRQASEVSAAPAALPVDVEHATQAVELTERQLREALPPVRTDDDTVLFLIGALDPLGSRHGVALGAVRPGGRTITQGFEAATFEVEAHGSYRSLVTWLRGAQPAIAPLVPTELMLDVVGQDRQLHLQMKVTHYALPASAPGGIR